MRTTTQLRRLVTRPEIAFLMEAHNGLSARIAEEAGFEGIWASGLSLSASFGVRDNNELSWTPGRRPRRVHGRGDRDSRPARRRYRLRQLQQHAPPRAEAGAGRRGRRLHRGQALPEDQLVHRATSCSRWPTWTSSAARSRRARTASATPTSCIVARVEALIAGWGLAEALKRAEAYHAAGADAILIHSQPVEPGRDLRVPRPSGRTAGPSCSCRPRTGARPTEDFRARRVSVVIWANHLLRAVDRRHAGRRRGAPRGGRIAAPRRAAGRAAPRGLPTAGRRRAGGGRAALPAGARESPLSAVVLAAGEGDGLRRSHGARAEGDAQGPGPADPAPAPRRLRRTSAAARPSSSAGHRAEAIDVPGARFVDNPDFGYHGRGFLARRSPRPTSAPGTLVAFGDIVLKRHIVQALLEEAGRRNHARSRQRARRRRRHRPRHRRPRPTPAASASRARLRAIGDAVAPADSHGVWIGLIHLGRGARAGSRETIRAARADGSLLHRTPQRPAGPCACRRAPRESRLWSRRLGQCQ